VIYPNPGKIGDPMWIQINIKDQIYADQSCLVHLEFYNPAGERVASFTEDCYAGMNFFTFDTTGLAGGIYFYRIILDGKANGTRKLVLYKY